MLTNNIYDDANDAVFTDSVLDNNVDEDVESNAKDNDNVQAWLASVTSNYKVDD